MERMIKYQRESDPTWVRRVASLPGCERIASCIQCGTCSAACPLSIYMDFTPRKIIALVREGFRTEALRSRTIWLCASCYACAVQCPQDIHITDVMYGLKREAIREGLYPRRFPIPVLARAFYDMVGRDGRNAEFWLVVRTALRSNPLMLIGMARSGLALLRTGRLSLRRERIRGARELQTALARSREAA